MAEFGEALYRLNREALHLFVDEADMFAPQKRADDSGSLTIMEDLVRRGRRKGIGVSLITQRPADIHKSVLTQAEILVLFRLVHPRDHLAIREWVELHSDDNQVESIMETLPSLPVGTAWFWSPSLENMCARVQVRRRTTFDSSATPTPGRITKVPKKLAAVDVRALKRAISSFSVGDDPTASSPETSELELDNRMLKTELAQLTTKYKRLEQRLERFSWKKARRLETVSEQMTRVADKLLKAADALRPDGRSAPKKRRKAIGATVNDSSTIRVIDSAERAA